MNKHRARACALAFLLLCAGALAFLGRFTRAELDARYLNWETAAAAAGETEIPFDPAALPAELPPLEEGGWYRYTLTLPQNRADGVWLLFETAGLETRVFLDGAEIWSSAALQSPDTVSLSRVQLPLPAGGGETLTMDLRLLGESGLFPPLPRLTADPSDQQSAMSYAAGYALPAGATALAALLLAGLFLLGLAQGRPDGRLLLPALAAALLTATVWPWAWEARCCLRRCGSC